jgi:hypothetical protein
MISVRRRLLLLLCAAIAASIGLVGLGFSLYRPWQDRLPDSNPFKRMLLDTSTWFYICRGSSAAVAVASIFFLLCAEESIPGATQRLRACKRSAWIAALLLPSPIAGLVLSTILANRETATLVLFDVERAKPELPVEHFYSLPLAVSVTGWTLGLIGAAMLVVALIQMQRLSREIEASHVRADKWS